MPKLFEFNIEERNGEQEYSIPCHLWADNLEEAGYKANKYAKNWYEGATREETVDGIFYEANGGANSWEVGTITEVSEIRVPVIGSEDLVFLVLNTKSG